MKKIFASFLAFASSVAFSATLNPVQLLNPSGSSSGQTIVSTGVSSAPAWANVAATALAAQAANTVVANATGSSASPTAFAMPSCSASGGALQWTSGTGFTCVANAFASPPAIGSTTPAAGSFTTLSASSTVSGAGFTSLLSPYAPLASPALTGAPTAPTATTGVNTTQLATTAFVNSSITAATGRLLNVQVFSTSGTYTPTGGTTSIVVKVQAPGGGGGGSFTTGSGQASLSTAGSSGSYAEVRYTSGIATQTVTVPGGGTAGTGGGSPTAGGTASAASFGSLISCPGGIGGGAGGLFTPPGAAGSANPPAACTISGGTTLKSYRGYVGAPGIALSATIVINSTGAPSLLGTNGNTQSGFGYGGFGSAIGQSTTGIAGGAGGGAFIEVDEYN